MSAKRLSSVGLCLLSACTFVGNARQAADDDPVDPSDPSEPGVDAPMTETDAPTPFVTKCDAADSDLRLCLEFDEPEAFVDHSKYAQQLTASNIELEPHDGGNAARFTPTSELTIAESPSLDVDQITTSMWIAPRSFGTNQFLLDNHLQYATIYEDDGDVRCVIGSTSIKSGINIGIPTGWTHVACTYDRSRIRVYVNGNLEGCTSYSNAINKSSSTGSAVGANRETASVTEKFVGGIDFVRVYSRVLTPSEICGHAGRTSCNDSCPSSGGSGFD